MQIIKIFSYISYLLEFCLGLVSVIQNEEAAKPRDPRFCGFDKRKIEKLNGCYAKNLLAAKLS